MNAGIEEVALALLLALWHLPFALILLPYAYDQELSFAYKIFSYHFCHALCADWFFSGKPGGGISIGAMEPEQDNWLGKNR
jgi:hypothetical protein